MQSYYARSHTAPSQPLAAGHEPTSQAMSQAMSQPLAASSESLAMFAPGLDHFKSPGLLVSYKTILSHQFTSKPKKEGGAPNPGGVTPLFVVTQAGGEVRVALALPNSFAPNDGLEVEGAGVGRNQEEAKEACCRQVLAKLLMTNPTEVRLLDKNWRGMAEAVKQDALRIINSSHWQSYGQMQPQRETALSTEPQPRTSRPSGYQAPSPTDDREAERRDLFTKIIATGCWRTCISCGKRPEGFIMSWSDLSANTCIHGAISWKHIFPRTKKTARTAAAASPAVRNTLILRNTSSALGVLGIDLSRTWHTAKVKP